MPIWNGRLGVPQNNAEVVVDTPYLKPVQRFILRIDNFQGRAAFAPTDSRLSEIAFYGNSPSNCSDKAKACDPNVLLFGLRVWTSSADNYTSLFFVIYSYFKTTTKVKIYNALISPGSKIELTIEVGNGKFTIKRGDQELLKTSYSVDDPIINKITYRVAPMTCSSPEAEWGACPIGNNGATEALDSEVWNLLYDTPMMFFDISKILGSIIPLVVVGSVLGSVFATRKKKEE